jgi:hypothetical protein
MVYSHIFTVHLVRNLMRHEHRVKRQFVSVGLLKRRQGRRVMDNRMG